MKSNIVEIFFKAINGLKLVARFLLTPNQTANLLICKGTNKYESVFDNYGAKRKIVSNTSITTGVMKLWMTHDECTVAFNHKTDNRVDYVSVLYYILKMFQ